MSQINDAAVHTTSLICQRIKTKMAAEEKTASALGLGVGFQDIIFGFGLFSHHRLRDAPGKPVCLLLAAAQTAKYPW